MSEFLAGGSSAMDGGVVRQFRDLAAGLLAEADECYRRRGAEETAQMQQFYAGKEFAFGEAATRLSKLLSKLDRPEQRTGNKEQDQ